MDIEHKDVSIMGWYDTKEECEKYVFGQGDMPAQFFTIREGDKGGRNEVLKKIIVQIIDVKDDKIQELENKVKVLEEIVRVLESKYQTEG